MTSCQCRSCHSDSGSPCRESVLAALSTPAHNPVTHTTTMPLRLRISMSGKCSYSTLNTCSQPCHTYNISTSLLYFWLQCDCGYQIQPSVINLRNNVCVKCVTFFHNCFSWAAVISCPNSIGLVSCEFNLQRICYAKSRQYLNMAGCCGCVVCYNG